MNDLLRKTRRAFHLLRELLKYETATCCAAVLKCWNKDYRHVWLVSERGREARDNGYHNKVVTMDGQVINAGGSFTGGSVQRSAGLFTRKQEMEELRLKAAKLQKDCLAAQEKTDQCKEQADALQAELTATASEQITAANDRVRAEAEQKRLEAAVQQQESTLAARQQEIDALKASLSESQSRAEGAAALQAELTAKVDLLTAEMNRIAEGDDSFVAQQTVLNQKLSAKRLEQVTRRKDAELAYSQIAALEQQLRENTAAAAQAENARKQAEAEIETHRKELESLGASTSDVTRQREEASQKLSDNRMQKLRTEKDLSLHEAALENLKGRSGEAEARVRELQANVAAAKERIAANELRANEIKRASEENKQKITAAEETIRKANAERMEKEAAVTRLTQENRTLTDERERMSGEMARLAERKTAAETELNTTASKLWEEYQLTEAEAEKLCVPFANVADLRRQVAEVRGKIRALGNVNVGAIEEYKEVKERYDFMKAQVTDVEKSRAELNRMIAELCSEMQEMFTASFKEINRNFGAIFRELFGGGSARLYLSDENDVLNSGIEIQVSPPGKVIKNLSALSGGEQALVAISIYFAILAVNPSPFCILDEIEAALDDVNVTRYAQYLRRMTERTQFIVITHRRGTMEAADVLYGVTMQEDGVSKILRLDLENVSADLIS